MILCQTSEFKYAENIKVQGKARLKSALEVSVPSSYVGNEDKEL